MNTIRGYCDEWIPLRTTEHKHIITIDDKQRFNQAVHRSKYVNDFEIKMPCGGKIYSAA